MKKPLGHPEYYAEVIVDTIREPLLLLDAQLHIITANKSFYKIFHVTKEDIQHKLIFTIGNGQWNNDTLKHLLKDIVPKKSWFQDLEIEHDFEGIGRRVVLLNARKVVQKGNKPPLILLAIEDITEKKALERQKDDFISIASHELKTPVTSIKLYGQMLQRHPLILKDKKASFFYPKWINN